TEQLAGDLLPNPTLDQQVASGFNRCHVTTSEGGSIEEEVYCRNVFDRTETFAQVFLALTFTCARCHDHKFDPVTQREFYQISAAIGGTYQGDERETVSGKGRAAADKRIAKLRSEIQTLEGKPELAAQRSRLQSVVRLLEAGKVHTTAPRQPDAWRILARGDYRQPGDVVSPRGIAAITGVSPDWGLAEDAPEAERRKALANWIADAKNPLTPRVVVNRLWAHHFGEGLVRTPSDLGFQGGQPSHPELLDWLAGQLLQPNDGKPWSLKHIQRLIVNSATYRQESRILDFGLPILDSNEPEEPVNPKSKIQNPKSIDADNRLLWRMNRRRLEAEVFRDAVLAASGELDLRIGGPGYKDYKVTSAGNNETYTVFDAVGKEFNRRSLYRTSVRSGTSPLLDTLDCPDPSVAAPRRSVTTTPLQALTLLNNVFTEHYAARFAERLKREAPAEEAAQIQRAYALAFGRPANEDELKFALQFIGQHGLDQFCVVIFNASEFLYVD
ncbi:MAG TPA: DUF1553 domain-containing protein, partial [Pirellulaceae bacterium]|nr:DUF1553 domain-containing protein [Pirellulaceae bacterium]